MSTCQIKKGMFVLGDCGNQAKGQCVVCGKHVCSKHAETEGTQIICVECYAKRELDQNNIKSGKKGAITNTQMGFTRSNFMMDSLLYYNWQSQMRYGFYNNHNYRPFDEKDYTGFEEINQTEFDDSNDTGGFFDS
jgi:hypothetical protein